jgi:hypothetical protein
MDAGLTSALQKIQDQLQQAADAASEGQTAASTVLFAQVSMSLGMYIGHFRVTLGQRYPTSPECEALNRAARLLNMTIVAAYESAEDEDEEEDSSEESPPTPLAPVPYGYSARADEDDE